MILRFLDWLRSFPPPGLLQNRVIQCQISYQPLETTILFLEVLEPPCLLHAQATVLFTPAIVGLLGDVYLSAGFRDRDTLVDVDLGFHEFVDDLLRSEAPSDHLSALSGLPD
jgi:hypothetical protein